MPSSPQNYQNILIETQIFPPIETVSYCINKKAVIFEAHENYQKRSFRNRYQIGSHQGLLNLSVPLVKGKNNQQPILEVKISYDLNWPTIHWKALQSSYGKSAFFIYYKELIEAVLFSECTYLFDLNLKTWRFIESALQLHWEILLTEEYQLKAGHGIQDLRSRRKFSNSRMFTIPEYYQVFSASTGFLPNLSILDLIFHLGPEAYSYLHSLSTHTINEL